MISETLKWLVGAVCIPIAISTMTFASKYGAMESSIDQLLENQKVMIATNKQVSSDINDMKIVDAQVAGDISSLKASTAQNTELVKEVANTTDGIKVRIATLSERIDGRTADRFTQQEAEFLIDRVDRLEGKIDNL